MPTPEFLLAVLAIFLVAGLVKGIAGLGLPTVAIALMAAFVGLKEGIALIVFPTLLTNFWQAVAGGRHVEILRRFWSLLAMAIVGAWIGAGILAGADAGLLAALLGVLLCIYSAISLTTVQIPSPGRAESWLSPLVGVTSGVLGGMTGSYAVPGVLYLQALGLGRDLFIQAMGVVFLAFTLALGAGLTRHGMLSAETAVLSLAATVPALAGMGLGQRVRRGLSEAAFRKVFFTVLLGLGAWLAVRPLFG